MEQLEWLYNLRRFGSKLGLERIKEICNALDNPQDKLKFIHIAGTNGKGSTSVMIQSILTEAGFKVGRFNSPHIIDFKERFSINDKWIPEEDLMRLIELIKSKNIELTFFEFITAIALQYFYDQKVDYVVWETGLGGRFDATNVVNSDIAVITNIAFDHTVELGNSLSKIGFEKAGIIKENSIVVYGGTPELKDLFEKGKKLVMVDFDVPFNFKVNLPGKHQVDNARIAVAAVREMNIGIKDRDIKMALAHIKWPGRLEKIGTFLLDCAHNPAGLKSLKYFIENEIKPENLTIVFGCMKDKDYLKMLQLLPKHNSLIVTKANNERALNPEKIAEYAKECKIFDTVSKAVDYAKKNSEGLILIAGSCYVVSEARQHIYSIYLKSIYEK